MSPHDHVGDRLSALVDGELSLRDRERALGHVAHCAPCRDLLESERVLKARLAGLIQPEPSARLLALLAGTAVPGIPLPPQARVRATTPVVPVLPPPGRGPRGGRPTGRGPSTFDGVRRPGGGPSRRSRRSIQRARYAAAGALSVAGLVLGTAFAAGGAGGTGAGTVVPPAAELSIEHDATTASLLLGDPGLVSVGPGLQGGTASPTALPTAASTPEASTRAP